MGTKLDVPLDDLIKATATASRGPVRRVPFRVFSRTTPYAKLEPAPDTVWKHDLFRDQVVRDLAVGRGRVGIGGVGEADGSSKLYISNLDYGVSNEDIKELFSEVGQLKTYGIHYDKSGRSKGTAEVVFERKADVVAAVKRYNGVHLDGKPMKIEIVGKSVTVPTVVQKVTNGGFGISGGVYNRLSAFVEETETSAFDWMATSFEHSAIARTGPARPLPSVPAQPKRRGGGGSDRGRGRGRSPSVSAADLDADLEKYHMEAMQT